MKFEDMNAMQRRLHNAAIVLAAIREEGYAILAREAIDEIERLRIDAERYRWLCENRDVLLLTGFFGNGCINRTIDEVHAAIDAAMLKTPNVEVTGLAAAWRGEVMREALVKLAKLGNEPYYGSSIGNQIARDALAKVGAGDTVPMGSNV